MHPALPADRLSSAAASFGILVQKTHTAMAHMHIYAVICWQCVRVFFFHSYWEDSLLFKRADQTANCLIVQLAITLLLELNQGTQLMD